MGKRVRKTRRNPISHLSPDDPYRPADASYGDVCYFFENGWEERLTQAAEEPFREYLKRNPPKKKTDEEKGSTPEGDPYL